MPLSITQCILCFAVSVHLRGSIQRIIECITSGNIFIRVVESTKNPFEEFVTVKTSGEPIVLFIANAIGHDAIRYLCDDYHLAKEQRRVQWIHSLSSGLEAYRLGELTKELAGIPFTNARGCYSSILAEHVVYSIMYFNRQTWRTQENYAARRWDPFDMLEARNMKLGIVGYGDIGRAAGRLAVALGMEVTGVKRTAPVDGGGDCVDGSGVRVVHTAAERDRVISESDFVLNILPGTKEMRGFFNKERFAMMKPSAVYINIGRGFTQNEDDLADALRNGVIRAAAVDVFEREPLPFDSPLWNIGNDKILLTNHNAFLSVNFAKQVTDFLISLIGIFGTKDFEKYILSDAQKFTL